jgi:hypothetical protein
VRDITELTPAQSLQAMNNNLKDIIQLEDSLSDGVAMLGNKSVKVLRLIVNDYMTRLELSYGVCLSRQMSHAESRQLFLDYTELRGQVSGVIAFMNKLERPMREASR